MRSLIFYCPENHPPRKPHDGDEFKREAHAFSSIYSGQLVPLTGPMKERRAQFISACNDAATDGGELVDVVAYFGHGTRRSLPGLCSVKRGLDLIADAIWYATKDEATVLLYACSAGNELGFALAEHLNVRLVMDGVVIGHTIDAYGNDGHTTRNPYVVAWPSTDDNPAGWWVDPLDKPMWKRWKAALKTDDYRFRFWEPGARRYIES